MAHAFVLIHWLSADCGSYFFSIRLTYYALCQPNFGFVDIIPWIISLYFVSFPLHTVDLTPRDIFLRNLL